MIPTIPNTAVARTELAELNLLARGKVRDVYAIDAGHLLIVATDRLSAYDVVLPDPIPGKGAVLTAMSDHWLAKTAHLCTNHATARRISDLGLEPTTAAQLDSRARIVRKTRPLPVEAVVRGYLVGSGWQDYQRCGAVSGVSLPTGLIEADELPSAIFTPATKAAVGAHDENIDYATLVDIIGASRADEVREMALALYRFAADTASERGIIIADTKFEFGLDDDDNLILIDEVLTPDSSRFWPLAEYRPGSAQPSFDKQFVRDYLNRIGWDRQPPGPTLPAEIVAQTRERYIDALRLLTA
ncbi:MAG: phosphoribosylaminoimidazolesuccinocarboxamide synthase [Pseudomonadota bacterium]